MPYGLVVRFTARDAAAAASFDGLVEETLQGIQSKEPGTLVYVSHVPVDEPHVRVFYELYADRDAFAAHEEQPHVKRFLTERGQYLASTEVTFLDEVAGKRPA
ncbi:MULTISPECIES: putative quinol monooxygenase [Streptomyces]|uniref:Antibiotic biosynthesis monooxygenase n=1 Tax=Streptomyces griseiscabiei TaxID=2993540 RepID=A0ABU4LJV6_9ACTN|nr:MULTISPECIES: antibiotic biosynthesis monooxygenase [Streptomyces]MBP5866085.1 antibiotic biosynthesis monooxygenase [Streptomyces sp. LBUM 1484]MBP5880777.1 antibiotic biosynthesis monooxygenase [Streptomyces sp. LBUM 1477]MBZ3908825.1 antibiotic biosynthesis monooxygenase [Streptomyces griseiscabiei]MDX2567508.1 antibiotic biosynthesis monooxygenase [Streptomyces scabiei]MDX2916100.1 antibiotic biosynthesis monooxygenase [Streptomyces griseiscabiei]